jgi:diphosphomevalonate decarboxylase
MMRAVAEANTNIALVKYWGKNDDQYNLPAVPSLSLTLDGLFTRTEVYFAPGCPADSLTLNGERFVGPMLDKVSRQLDRLATALGLAGRQPAAVHSRNNFPTAAGLASSASAFAALTVAATAALLPADWQLSDDWRYRLAILARQGSGSAARSLFGGLVVLGTGTPGQVDSAAATPLLAPADWPELRLVIGVASESAKDTGSTDGMRHTAQSSPYFAPFVAAAPADLRAATAACLARDLEQLGTIAERSALRMHASALAADPAVCYLRGATVEGLHALRALRQRGIAAFFTCDAGPHPKALTTAADADAVAATLAAVPGVLRTIIARPGAGARVLAVGAEAVL